MPYRFLSAFVAVLALLAPARPAAADEYLKIGAWNIENLGGRVPNQHPAAIAEHILLADVDILALEEIWDTDGVPETMTSPALDQVFQRVNEGDDADWTYVLFANRTDGPERHTGIAWNRKRATMVGEPLKVPVAFASEATWNRIPHAVKFTAGERKTDLVLIPLHMKSNRVDDTMPDLPATEEIRRQEAEALVAQLPAIKTHFHEEDIVLLGDTNCLSETEPAMEAYKGAGFTDLNAANVVTYDKGMYRSPFDRILIPSGQEEFRFSNQYVLTPTSSKEHRRKLSDHFLVLTAVRVLRDDDE